VHRKRTKKTEKQRQTSIAEYSREEKRREEKAQ
jgi:hypothetical protein